MFMYYKCYQMMESEAEKMQLMRACCRFASRVAQEGARATAFQEKEPSPTGEQDKQVLEYLCVESWNVAVKKNAMHRSQEVKDWMALSLDFSRFLSDDNVTKLTVEDFATSMPILTD
ncbi:hypothetical protein STCU_10705 [Strigomonas culicis]|uniref:Uncharacterized protein n=1 Tax=Strigomonas culicis TaxID=28005 RepID=S9URQ5_9TRYP|nr:hypothetical protein STCU_10705 [Strigomonas culicis]|eukprot:EPY17281.1 hypothetical protein STCU_10705 [Strigomonas culicis]